MCFMFFQSGGESPTSFTNVSFTTLTRDAVNAWVVVRRSVVLMCVKNKFELVCRAMAHCYVGGLENMLNVV